jgi:hypothetical protein
MSPRQARRRFGAASVSTAVVLMAVGGIIAFGIRAPASIEEYVDLLDLGLILIWSGVLLLVMQVVMFRPRRPRRSTWDDRTDQWYANDVHRPGYVGQTEVLPTVRGGRRR